MIKPEGIQTVTSGSTVTVSNGVGILVVNPSSLLAALTVTFPSTPNDRDYLLMQFGGTMTSGLVVTALAVTGAASIIGSVPVATAGMCSAWIYNVALNKWLRLY
jgi:hypothetical protein